MPYITLTRKSITIDVVDKVFHDSIFKQKAVFTGLSATVAQNTNELSITIETRSDLYSVLNGSYGEKIEGDSQFISKTVELYANNECLVYFNPQDPTDVKNGDILYKKSTEFSITGVGGWAKVNPDGTLQPPIALADVPEPCTLQGDLFGVMMDNPMILNQLIEKHMIAANSPIFNKYK